MAGIVPSEYTKTAWANDAEGGTPINATRLNNIEDALEDVNEYAREGSVELPNNTYPGRNLATVFADEITEAGSIWAFLHARAQAKDDSGMRIGDYVDITLSNSNVMRYQIGAFGHNYNAGDTAQPWTFFMVPTTTYPDNVQWNTTATNQGTSAEKNPYMVSNLHTWMTTTFYNMLPADLHSILVDYRTLMEERYNASSQLTASTGWAWKSIGKVFALSEVEVYGECVWGTKSWSEGEQTQLPIFRETKDRIKGRAAWWLRVAYGSSASDACYVSSHGDAARSSASNTGVRPLPCFLIG